MLKQVLETALIVALVDSGLSTDLPGIGGGLPTITDYNFSMEVAKETDFGAYNYDFADTEFTLPISIGSGYNGWTFSCSAGVYAPNDDGTYDIYPDNGDMGTSTFTVGEDGPEIMHGKTETYEAEFTVGFFKNDNYNRENWYHIRLVFNLDGTPPEVDATGKAYTYPEDTQTSYSFYAEAIMQGYGEYTISSGTKEFYPVDDHIVFGCEDRNGNVTEVVDFSNTRDAICEEKYLALNEDFEVTFTTLQLDNIDAWGIPKYSSASICVKDPKNYFPYMHENGNPNFQISLLNCTPDVLPDHSEPLTATFEVGGETYWVEPNTLVMSKTERYNFKETEQFFFKCGYFEEIKENCEFYLRMRHVGHNEATYNIKLDFLGDHDYFGSCLDSNYCMHSGRG